MLLNELKLPHWIFEIFLQSPGCSCACGKILPDGKAAVLGYADGSIRVFDLKTQNIVHTLSKMSCVFIKKVSGLKDEMIYKILIAQIFSTTKVVSFFLLYVLYLI